MLIGVHLVAEAVVPLAAPLIGSLQPDTPPILAEAFVSEGLAQAVFRLVLGVVLIACRPLHRWLPRAVSVSPEPAGEG